MLKAILTAAPAVANQPRFNVGIIGTAPSGLEVNRPRFLIKGPWCKSTARAKAKRLQSELDKGLIGRLLGWLQ